MEPGNVLAELKKTEKGKLVYGNTYDLSNDKITIPPTEQIFDLKSLSSILETIENDCYAEAENQIENQIETSKKENTLDISVFTESKSFSDGNIINLSLNNQVATVIEQLDSKMKEIRSSNIEKKIRQQQDTLAKIHHTAELAYAKAQQKVKESQIIRQEQINKFIDESQQTRERLLQENVKQHKFRDKVLKTKLQEAENRKLLKQKQNQERLSNALLIVNETKQIHLQLINILSDQRYQYFASNSDIQKLANKSNMNYTLMSSLYQEGVNKNGLAEAELNDIIDMKDLILEISRQFSSKLDALQAEKNKSDIEKERLQKQKEEREKERIRIEKIVEEKEREKNNPESNFPPIPNEYNLSVSRSAYHQFKEMENVFKQFEETSKSFTSLKQNQKLIMGLSKAISLPISSITNRSWSDIKRKRNDLNALLNGKSFKSFNQNLSINNADQAPEFAKIFMAKKFVKQAEGQVSANHEAAFGLALTLVGVWSKNPEVKKLTLAQMCIKCPFIIPWYIPKLENQDEKVYNKSRGYLYNEDGTVEKQDKYLKRMSGLVRSFAAIIQSPLPPDMSEHPFGLWNGWTWLTRMLNLEPWPEITATILYDFLDVAGHALLKTYGQQFEKLLFCLCRDYFPKIKEVSSGTSDGAIPRLEMFLKDCIKTRNVRKPEGYLGTDFWTTYHSTEVVGS